MAQRGALLQRFLGISPVLQRVLVSFWRTGALGATMHTTALLPPTAGERHGAPERVRA